MFNEYVVMYDLTRPGQNYPALFARLLQLGGQRQQNSVWLVRYGGRSIDLANDLVQYVDRTDRVFVVPFHDAAWFNSIGNPEVYHHSP